MNLTKKLARLLCGLLCLCLCLSACKKEVGPATTDPQATSKDVIYTISLKTAGGMILQGVSVYVYKDATEQNLLTYGTLDSNGIFVFTAAESDRYTVRFANLPKEGYDVQECYPITSTKTNIVLTSSVITGKDALEEEKTYELGDVMRDFAVTTVDGKKLTLSQILEKKHAVVLNFWYTGDTASAAELPLLQKAYEAFGEKIEVIAMNPADISGDNEEKITQFRDQHGLTFPMVTCSSQWLAALGVKNYGTTVIIDRYGVICLLDGVSVEEEGVFEAAFQHFTAEPYGQKLLDHFSDLHVVEYPLGHEKNPYETHGAANHFQVTIPAGAEYHILIYKADGVTLQMENPNIYVRYGEKRYDPDAQGKIHVLIENPDVMVGSSLVIGNTGDVACTVDVQIKIPQGTSSTPYDASLGEVTVQIPAGNDRGVYYSWVAAESGVLTLTVLDADGFDFNIQIHNTNTTAVRDLQEEAQEDENGNRYLRIDVNAGDEVRIGYMTIPDGAGNYPAVTIKAELSFTELDEMETLYLVSVKDEAGNPMENVTVCVVVNGVEVPYYTDAAGNAEMMLLSGVYTVKVMAPAGYACENNQFLLTPANSTKEVVMRVDVPQEVEYTVYVQDETGAPVANAAVVLNGEIYYTDADGLVVLVLPESDDYVVTIVPPEGYTLENAEIAFGTVTSLTVTVSPGSASQQTVEYTIFLKDHTGTPYVNAQIRLDSEDGTLSMIEAVDAEGKLVIRLPENNYFVTILFDDADAQLGYDPVTAKLTPGKTELTVELVPFVSEEGQFIYPGGEAYFAAYVSVGSVYADLTDMDIRFFLFTPDQPGTYIITTANPDTGISYWSDPSAPNEDPSAVVNNVCTLEVKEAGTSFVLAIRGCDGVAGTVLKISRTDSASADPACVFFWDDRAARSTLLR